VKGWASEKLRSANEENIGLGILDGNMGMRGVPGESVEDGHADE
jgi:hypothetical protein